MNQESFSRLTSATMREINEHCDRFEEAWNAYAGEGNPPSVAQTLSEFSYFANDPAELVRPVLCRALIQLDIEWRSRKQLPWNREMYLKELPDDLRSVILRMEFRNFDAILSKEVSAPNHGSAASSSEPRFKKLRKHAHGGLGLVSVAEDRELHREVALKEIQLRYANDHENRSRFVLEAEITGRLEHPGIVPVYGLGRFDDGRPYYAMRFIRGRSLKEAILQFHRGVVPTGADQGRIQQFAKPSFSSLEFRKLLNSFVDACNAIEYAHSKGVLHRDLKPDNIMVGQYGETLVVDWGLAKVASLDRETKPSENARGLPPSGGVTPTHHGSAIGTPAYMSPEQAKGALEEIGKPSDVYGLGATLYFMLTCEPPFAGRDLTEILDSVKRGSLLSPRNRNASIPPPLNAICLKAMSLSPQDRYASPIGIAEDIDAWLADLPTAAYREPLAQRIRRWIKRHPKLSSATAAVVVVSTISLAMTSTMINRKNAELSRKNRELTVAQHQSRHNEQLAKKQSEVALQTLAMVIRDVQSSLRDLSGDGSVRQRILLRTLSRLDELSTEYLSKSAIESESVEAMINLGEVAMEYGLTDPVSVNQTDAANTEPTVQGSAFQLAERYFNRAIEVSRHLVAEDRSDMKRSTQLAMGLAHRADLKFRAGDSEASIEAANESIQVFEHVAKQSPSSSEPLRNLMIACTKLGDVQLEIRDSAGALESFARANDTKRMLYDLEPANQILKRDLLIGIGKLAQVHLVREEFPAAQRLITESLQLAQSLVKESPNNDLFQRDVSICSTLQGDVHRHLREFSDAESSYSIALEIDKLLASRDPTSVQGKRDVALTLSKLGEVYSGLGQVEKAISSLKESLEIEFAISKDDPSNGMLKSDIAVISMSLGNIYYVKGALADALGLFQQAASYYRLLRESDPSNPQRRIDLAKSLSNMGIVLQSKRAYREAQELVRQVIDVLEGVDAEPHRERAQSMLASHWQQLGDLYRLQGDYSAMDECNRSSHTVLQQLHSELPKSSLALELEYLGREIEAARSIDVAFGDLSNLNQKSPSLVPALLMLRASNYLHGNEYEKAAEAAGLVVEHEEANLRELYRAAILLCLCADVAGNEAGVDANILKQQAIESLRLAFEQGYRDPDQLRAAYEFRILREQPTFQDLLEEMSQK